MVPPKIPGLYTFKLWLTSRNLKTTIRNDFWETNFNHYSPGDCLIFRACFLSFHIQLGSVPAGLYRPLGLWVYACVKCGFYDFMLNPALERHTSLKNTCTKIKHYSFIHWRFSALAGSSVESRNIRSRGLQGVLHSSPILTDAQNYWRLYLWQVPKNLNDVDLSKPSNAASTHLIKKSWCTVMRNNVKSI